MKKLTRLFLNTALAATLFAGYSVVRAQDQNPPADAPAGDHPAMKGEHGGRMAEMKEKLGLSDAQVAKLKAAMKKEAEANKTLRDQEKIDLDTLRQKVDSKASDDELKGLIDKIKADHKQLAEARENFMDKNRNILTPTQQAKWVLMMGHDMREGWGGKGKWEHKKDGAEGDKPADAAAPAPAAQ